MEKDMDKTQVVEIRSMKMDLEQPPWANELLARNRKVGRSIWSTSTTSDIHPTTSSFTFEFSKGTDKNDDSSGKRTEDKEVTDLSSNPTRRILRKGNSIHEEVFGATWASSIVPGREMRETPFNLVATSSGEESILEYGPGIVRKLRTKYQSLASRQPSIRPSLNRSTSLEHSLDFQAESTASPSPRPGSVSPSLEKDTEGMMTLNVRTTTTYTKVGTESNKSTTLKGRSRGRSGGASVEEQNRIRRARSVDSLQYNHHHEYTRQEEEILEKLKTVVLPKEEVVIIEMSKPRLNLGNLVNGDVHQNVINALVSPKHELPPHFIVRDTARKFEPNPAIVHQWKKVGQILRNCKSPTFSETSSPCSSPLPSSPVITPTEKKIQIVPAQPQQQRSVSVENEGSPRIMNNFQANKVGSKSNPSGVTGGVKGQTLNSPGKQVGVIRPTVNGIQKSNSVTSVPPRPATLPWSEPSPTINSNRVFQFITPPTKPVVGPKPVLMKSNTTSDLDDHEPKNSSQVDVQPKIKEVPSGEPSKSVNLSETQRPLELKIKLHSKRASSASPVSSKVSSPTTSNGETKTIENVTTFPIKLKPTTTNQRMTGSLKVQGIDNSTKTTNSPTKSSQLVSSESQNNVKKQPYNDTSARRNPVKSEVVVPPAQAQFSVVREGDALKKPKSVTPESQSEEKSGPVSQLRSHQKQKLQQSTTGGSMVFNFTNRVKVPDYIEDDGLHVTRGKGDDLDDTVDGLEKIDPKLIQFAGANVIINGKSSIQKKPKSQKMSIRFNEEGTTTFEYPSESSLLRDDDDTKVSNDSGSNNNLVTGNSSGLLNNITGGSGLSTYTPSKVVPNSYQLGFYRETDSNSNRKSSALDEETSKGPVFEDYLKPDSGTTTWSNELGAADILF